MVSQKQIKRLVSFPHQSILPEDWRKGLVSHTKGAPKAPTNYGLTRQRCETSPKGMMYAQILRTDATGGVKKGRKAHRRSGLNTPRKNKTYIREYHSKYTLFFPPSAKNVLEISTRARYPCYFKICPEGGYLECYSDLLLLRLYIKFVPPPRDMRFSARSEQQRMF